jgi:outer membrane protein TolC
VLLVACVVAAFRPGFAAAQDRNSPEDSVRIAATIHRLSDAYALLATSPRVRAARLAAEATATMVAEAGTLTDPQLQFGLMNRELPSLAPMSPLGMTQLQLMQMLPLNRSLHWARTAAAAAARADGESADGVLWNERARVAAAYHEIVRIDRAVAIVGETKLVMERMLTVARAMYEVGDGRQADVLRARVQVEQMAEELLRLDAERSAAAARLNGLLDRPIGAVVAPTDSTETRAALPSLDALGEVADERRPELRAAAARVGAATAELEVARRELWPELQVGIAYGQRRDGGMTERMGSLMLGASLPVSASRRQLAARREREAMLAMAQADQQAMRAETRAELEELLAELRKTRRLQLLYRESILPQAAAAVESLLSAYRAGDLPFMSLAESQVALNGFRLEYASLQSDEGRLWAALEALVATALDAPGAP